MEDLQPLPPGYSIYHVEGEKYSYLLTKNSTKFRGDLGAYENEREARAMANRLHAMETELAALRTKVETMPSLPELESMTEVEKLLATVPGILMTREIDRRCVAIIPRGRDIQKNITTTEMADRLGIDKDWTKRIILKMRKSGEVRDVIRQNPKTRLIAGRGYYIVPEDERISMEESGAIKTAKWSMR